MFLLKYFTHFPIPAPAFIVVQTNGLYIKSCVLNEGVCHYFCFILKYGTFSVLGSSSL